MIKDTKAIVLSRIKYSDNGLIVSAYTEEFGLLSFLIYVGKSKAVRAKQNLLQPLFLLDMQIYHKEKNSLQKVKNYALELPFSEIPFDIKKRGIAFFLAEFLVKTLRENEKDAKLFSFLHNSIQILDATQGSIANFHLAFLASLSKFLGIFPENKISATEKIFDIRLGKFIIGKPQHKDYLPAELSLLFSQILGSSVSASDTIKIDAYARQELLQKLIDYYYYHLERPKQLKSLDVLKALMQG